jgi:hypothetical protein
VREPGVPTPLVLDWHGGHDLFGRFAGHRPENALTYSGMCGTDGVCGNAPFANGKNLRRRLDVEPADQCGESGSVEAMDGGPGGGQLDRMAALRGQMQICPCDDVLLGVRGKPPQAKSTQHRTETDLDADQFEGVVRASSEDHIGDPCHALPH